MRQLQKFRQRQVIDINRIASGAINVWTAIREQDLKGRSIPVRVAAETI